MKYNENGEEMLDDTPLEAPLKFKRPLSIQELIALHVRAAQQVENQMEEDEEDLDDDGTEFDDILTPYELHEYSADTDRDIRRRESLNKLREGKNGPRTGKSAGEDAEGKEAGDGTAGTGKAIESGKESSGGSDISKGSK